MLSKDAFIDFILSGDAASPVGSTEEAALPEGIAGFDTAPVPVHVSSSFARRLLEASGFGYAELIHKDNVIRSSDRVAHYLPERVCFWPKTLTRPYQTLLFEVDLNHKELLNIPAFKAHNISHLDDVEAALARFVSEALEGFQRGGESVTADVRKGRKEETLCLISIMDTRDTQPVRLVCFGTQNAKTAGLETFQIAEQTKLWDRQLAREHLELLYERQFKKLETKDWQEAFTTTEERKQAEKLLEICTRKAPDERDVQQGVLDLLDTIAKGFGLRKKPKTERRLVAYALPPDHDIGIDPDERQSSFGGHNPFGGVTLRDERSRLLGYIIYPLKNKTDASRLHKHLKENNRFHNVLVVYPNEEQASLELWQGKEQLTGKLRKGYGYRDAADVVNLLSRFFVVSKANVRVPSELAEELAYRARYLRRIALKQLNEEPKSGPLRNLYNGFKESLVHDQTEEEFADAFAQTLTYSLLTARWVTSAEGTPIGDRFTRKAAMQKLSIGSRFLSEMFSALLEMDLDDQRARLNWLVDDITELLVRIDVVAVFNRDQSDLVADPIIHFYEPFLHAYDPDIRRQRGVFYTPRPIVSYIVRTVDELLRTEFLLEDGLADTTSWGEMAKRHKDLRIPEGMNTELPFVQILDPATGTGTFLVEAIELIHTRMLEKWKAQGKDEKNIEALWIDYVPKHLLPRLHGYELLMAPYAIAHLKVGLKLFETGYHFTSGERARIYLTNALEPAKDFSGRFEFAIPALAHEAESVDEVKRTKRFTVVTGNPPYANFGQLNRIPFILELLEDYKRDLDEKKINLDDDFIKFIRLSQFLLSKAGYGLHAMITNNAYLDGITHRQMRRLLLEQFDQATVFDLHGNARKGEVTTDGAQDENVFDIMQGVAIGIFARSFNKSDRSVRIAHIQGTREQKYNVLNSRSENSISFVPCAPVPPYYLFRSANDTEGEYSQGVSIADAFKKYQSPIQTKRDGLTIHFNIAELEIVLDDLRKLPDAAIREKYKLAPDGRDWMLPDAKADVKSGTGQIIKIAYKPFDFRYTYYSPKSRGFLAYPRDAIMKYMLPKNSRALVFKRQAREDLEGYSYFFATNCPFSEGLFAIDPRGREFLAPLHLVSGEELGKMQFPMQEPETNITLTMLAQVNARLRLDESLLKSAVQPVSADEIFHYMYAVFHSPGYRQRYANFLTIDFPRLPLTANLALFRGLAHLGEQLVAVHVMESPTLDNFVTTYVGPKNPKVTRIGCSHGAVWLDAPTTKRDLPTDPGTVGFRGVSDVVWNFHIGGYQVCEKWLKSRKGRTLSAEDISHYQKIIVAIDQTIQLMKEVDEIIEKHGGWPAAFIKERAGVTNA